ncbi:MAG: Multi antimicrobial extrusion protein [Myxococcaceae bacterium]|nr:Multi antimicrobial extrusion protein [Myxococcaceae bacterium]
MVSETSEPTSAPPLGWEASPVRALLALTAPITLSLLSFACMGLVDTFLVGRLGAAQLAGVGLGIVVTNCLMGFGFGLLRGVKVLLAQARGAGTRGLQTREDLTVYAGAGLLVALELGLGMLLLGEVAAYFAPRFTASAEAGRAAQQYIALRSLGMPVILSYVALREARYGFGETRSPLISALAGNVTHALLDVLFLYVLDLGATGAALANVLAFTLQVALLSLAQRELGFGLALGLRASRAVQWEVVCAGAFTGMQFVLEIASLTALSLLLAGVSDHQMAAHQIAVQLSAFCFLPALAIAESATVLAAEAVGSGRFDAVYGVARAARKVALTYAGFCACVLTLGGGLIAELFTSDRTLQTLVRTVLVAVSAHQVFESLAASGHGLLRGVGATRVSALCALGCAWLCTPWLGYLLVRHYELGAVGAWIARAVELVCASLIVWRYIERGSWLPGIRALRYSSAHSSTPVAVS